jgi:hypothetical protein
MKLLTLSKRIDYFENIVIDFNNSGPNGFEFELLGEGFIVILIKFTLLNARLKFLL